MTTENPNKKLDGFKAILGFIADPVIVVDSKGQILAANNILGKYTQPAVELVNQNLMDLNLFDTEQAIIFLENLRKRLQGHQIAPYEVKVKGKGNKEILLEINAKKINYEGEDLDVIVLRDVTRRAQSAIQVEEKFTGIAHSIKDILVIVDEDAKITCWNQAAEVTFGYSSKETLGKVIHELTVPLSKDRVAEQHIWENVKVFSEAGLGYFSAGNMEIVAVRKDGTEFPAELSVSPMKVGDKWNAVAVLKDISTRKQANHKLREAEQKYHMLFSQAPLGVLVIDPETLRFVEFNDKVNLFLGYAREEFEKISLLDIQAERTPDQVRSRVKEILEKGSGEYQVQYKTKTGEKRNVIVTSKAVMSNGKSYLYCIAHDITENKKIQEALVESEARFRQFVEAAQEGIWVIDNDFVTTFVNPYMADMLGYKENEILGKKLTEFLDLEWIETITAIIRGFTKNNLKNQYEYAFPHKNGGHVYTLVTLSVVADTENQKIGTLAVVSNITERKRVEKALKASEELFRAISTSAMDAIILSDAKDQILYWNPAAEKMYGFSQNEAIGKKLAELIIPEQFRNKHNQLLSNVSKESVSRREFGLTAIRKNGTTLPVDLSMVTVKIQEQNCLLSIIKDITEWKAMEEKLRQERDLLESVAMSTNIILATINRDYRITWVNKKGNQAVKSGSLENQFCYETFGRGSSDVCEGCGVKRVFDNNESLVQRDYTFIDDDGKEKWVELISTPIKDKNGYVNSALEISIDITERKRLQNKLADYSQRLEEIVQKRTDELKKTQAELVKSERLAAIGELAGMIGHDLRNPLTGIKNSAYYLKKKGQDLPQEQKEMIDTIDKCVDYSNRIINDLLDYSREIHLILRKQSAKKLLNESLALVNLPPKVKVNNELNESALITVDSDKIERVFINLLKNAVEAMPEGGIITINAQESKDSIEIAFTDTGVGINEETLPKLFAPLFTTKAQGMGFGLAICKRIIEAHKGTIVVKSVKGQGTTFTLTLPVNLKMEYGGEKVWINNPASS